VFVSDLGYNARDSGRIFWRCAHQDFTLTSDVLDSDKPLTVEYALTRAELLRTTMESLRAAPAFRNQIAKLAAIVTGAVFILRAAISRTLSPVDVGVAVACGLGFVVLVPFGIAIRGKTGRRSLSVSRGGMATTIGRISREYSWSAVKAVSASGENVVVALANGNAFFVPRRAFVDVAQRREFVARIENGLLNKL
jgi:YcxB-like protein